MGLASFLQDSPLMLVGEAETVDQTREILQTQPVDLLLMESRLGGADSLHALHEFKLNYPYLPILVFSAHDFPTVLAKSNHYGAAGFLRMTADRNTIIATCLQAIRQENLWTSEDMRRLGTSYLLQSSDVEHDVPLTRREVQVLRLLCKGNSNKEIAGKLEISYETVKEHIRNILRKLKVGDRTQAAIWATRIGLFYD
jgi:DNA-binding NarL/FixJ family response regulator